MNKFAHMSDIHLGAHREPVLQQLELKCFNLAMDKCAELGLDFVLISGDLFHVGIPDLGIVNAAVKKMRELQEVGLRIYAIYGSHDYNPASTSVIDVIETAGLLTNVSKWRELKGKVRLDFCKDPKTGAKLTGLSARRIGLESKHYENLEKRNLEEEEGFKVFAFHSGITELKPPHLSEMETIPMSYLPRGFDYYAGGHIHERGVFRLPGYERVVFPGPLFTGYGRDIEVTARGEKRGFYVVSFEDRVKKVEFTQVESFDGKYVEYDATGKNSMQAAKEIRRELDRLDVSGSVVALKVRGELSGGKTSDISFSGFRSNLTDRGALHVYVNRHALTSKEYTQIKFSGEDASTIEAKSFKERIGDVKVAQRSLKGERGVALAQELLKVLRQDAKMDESKKAYLERLVKDSVHVLELKETIDVEE